MICFIAMPPLNLKRRLVELALLSSTALALVLAGFGFSLDETTCNSFGADKKHTIIYELELCAAVLALAFWADRMKGGLQVCFGDNDGARFSLIRGPDIIFTERPQTIYAFGMLECLQRLTSVTFLRGELTTLC